MRPNPLHTWNKQITRVLSPDERARYLVVISGMKRSVREEIDDSQWRGLQKI
jgi:hypothetical protein